MEDLQKLKVIETRRKLAYDYSTAGRGVGKNRNWANTKSVSKGRNRLAIS